MRLRREPGAVGEGVKVTSAYKWIVRNGADVQQESQRDFLIAGTVKKSSLVFHHWCRAFFETTNIIQWIFYFCFTARQQCFTERERLLGVPLKYNNGHPSIFCDFIYLFIYHCSLLNSKLPNSCFSTSRLTKSLMMWSTVSSAVSQDSVSSHGPTNSHSTGWL